MTQETTTKEKDAKQKTVFIVDDDSFLLDMYALRFTQAGYHVETAMNADQTIEKLKSGIVPDVMLLDVVMPVTDGFELLEKMNSEGIAKNVLKIYLSNLGQDQDIARGKELGAVGYIVKASSTPSEVVAKVEEIIHGNK
ncbi:MAG TPA: response regulator [Candidatus Paceibacterota bacterium]|nr:response regulator [Candidatus Paceibacterota bacterium]